MRLRLFISSAALISLFTALSVMAADVPKPTLKPNHISQAPVPNFKPESGAKSTPISQSNKATISPLKSLSNRQLRHYREIFDAQKSGAWDQSIQLHQKISNPLLMGHVLAAQYLHPSYKSSYVELAGWMENYADHPQAARIYKLARSKRSHKAKGTLKTPVKQNKILGNLAAISIKAKRYKSQKNRTPSQSKRVQKLSKSIRRHIERNEPTAALNLLNSDYAVQFIDDVEYDRLRADVAAGYLSAGKLKQALQLSGAALNRSGEYAPLAGWVKGLAHWRKQDYGLSAASFEMAANSPYASGWMVSAAAYWASRAHLRGGNSKLVSQWLNLSASHPRTFYGLIATRALGHDHAFNWSMPRLTRDHVKFIEDTVYGARAAALIRVNQHALAGAELKNIKAGGDIEKQQALFAYAHHHQLPALLLKMGNAYASPDEGRLYDAALYPLAAWEPQGGYRVDKALIHAIVRQESRFVVSAKNPSGATGLMQLMPATAKYVAGGEVPALDQAEVNLEIGQKYIEELLDNRAVKQDVLSLTLAYNAGPGNLSKWKRERSDIKDPLLFIETIPYRETRAFVERVLSNYWIYKIRLGQDTPSLDAVTEGKWALYDTP